MAVKRSGPTLPEGLLSQGPEKLQGAPASPAKPQKEETGEGPIRGEAGEYKPALYRTNRGKVRRDN